MKSLACALVAALLLADVASAAVVLSYVENTPPATGFRSYTVRATGIDVNVLGRFAVTGNVYQVWTHVGKQSEWIGMPDGSTPGSPLDSYVMFGNERVPDLPVAPGASPNPSVTIETITGGTSGLGTLNNWVDRPSGEALAGDNPPGERLPAVPGDANYDGAVDVDDIDIVAMNWCLGFGATWAMGDFNLDGAVGLADASILAANWGYGVSEACAGLHAGTPESLLTAAGGTTGGMGDAYVALSAPTDVMRTVDLLHLVVPEGDFVFVELEVTTVEDTNYDGLYDHATVHEFFGENGLSVPEPSACALLALGVACLLSSRVRKC